MQKGLESIPYYLAPATVGYAIDKKIKKKVDKINKEETEKIASVNREKLVNAGKISVEKAAEGLGRTLFPAAVSVTTGRNIMNSFRELEEKNKNTTQEDMANKIVININGGSKRAMKKQVSKKLDEALSKKASSELNELVEEIRDKNSLIKDKKKLQGKKIHIGNGIKKQFSMQEMHGSNPMHPQG